MPPDPRESTITLLFTSWNWVIILDPHLDESLKHINLFKLTFVNGNLGNFLGVPNSFIKKPNVKGPFLIFVLAFIKICLSIEG